MLCYFTFPPFYSVFTLILYCACVLHISAQDRNSVPLVFLHSLRHIYKLPFSNYMVTHGMSPFFLYDVISHYHHITSEYVPTTSNYTRAPSDYSRLPIARTLKGKSKKVRVIESSNKIAASKVKNSFYCTVNVLSHFIAEMLSEN